MVAFPELLCNIIGSGFGAGVPAPGLVDFGVFVLVAAGFPFTGFDAADRPGFGAERAVVGDSDDRATTASSADIRIRWRFVIGDILT
jgi:hypothetical protein